VGIELFRDDDQGYAAWLAANARSYVLNIQRALNPSDARVHHAGCRMITGTPPRGITWTGTYVKACSLTAGTGRLGVGTDPVSHHPMRHLPAVNLT
jgi:hypothetical protein